MNSWTGSKALLAAATLVTGLISSVPAAADYMYSYRTAASNPLQGVGADNFISLSFIVPSLLAPNSAFDISVSSGPSIISSWLATDDLAGIALEGHGTHLTLVPFPGAIAGGALSACTGFETCLGGTVITDQQGRITAWNLVANDIYSAPYLTFITYSNEILGSIDGLGSTIMGSQNLQLNSLNSVPGNWTLSEVSAPIGQVPEPSPAALITAGALLLFAFRGWQPGHRPPNKAFQRTRRQRRSAPLRAVR